MAFLDDHYRVERPDAELYVEQVGPEAGSPIYFLHGGPGYSSYSFRELAGDDLETYRMIYADQRGAGRSFAEGEFGLDELAGDVVAVTDSLGLEQTTLLAHGFGALVAARTVDRAPERVDRLVLVNPWFSMPLLARALQREASLISRQGEQSLPPEDALADPDSLDPEALVDQAFGQVSAKHLFDVMQFPEPSSRLRLEHTDSVALVGPDEPSNPRDPWTLDVRPQLAAIRHPTVVLAGREDRTSYPEQVEAGLERLRHALFSLLPGGHYPWIDAPDDFRGLLLEAMGHEG